MKRRHGTGKKKPPKLSQQKERRKEKYPILISRANSLFFVV
jgi:hypothetical protein